jgi:RNA polymerase sigma-70 factor, ECF subfamily
MKPVSHQGAAFRGGMPGVDRRRRGRLPELIVVSPVGKAMTFSQNDPASWLRAIAQRRDKAAFAALFGAFAPRIKGFLIKTGSPASVAEELAQETMLTVWRKADLFDPAIGTPSAWIYAIARNLRIDRLRHDKNANFVLIYQVLEAELPRPDETAEVAAHEEQIRIALGSLPDEQAAVVRLSFYEDKAHADIARILGIPLGTVKSRLRLAMGKLRRDLGETS